MDFMHPPQWSIALAGWYTVASVVLFVLALAIAAIKKL